MAITYHAGRRIQGLSTDLLTPIQGFDGGQGHATAYTSGGGGGSSSVGANAVSGQAGNGGTGTQSDITGASPTPYYSAGGGGGLWGTGSTAGSGGSSIGGNGSSANNAGGNASGYGSGGGGAGVQSGPGNGVDQTGGNGSAGIVILRFTTSGNGYDTPTGTHSIDTSTVSGQTIISWTAGSGTFTPTSAFDVRYLVIGGGGGGGASKSGNAGGGGAGAGGFRTATGHGVTAKTYNITVGALGAGGVAGTGNGSNGSDSSFDGIISIGGGGGSIGFSATNYGQDGASGGGASPYATTNFGQAIQQIIPKPSNVQVGSRFEETDTRKMYYRDDIDFKELDGNEATNYRSDSWYEQLSGETP